MDGSFGSIVSHLTVCILQGDLFGDVVSSSDDDDDRPDSDEGSRLSAGGFKDYLKDDIDGKLGQEYSFSQLLQPSNVTSGLIHFSGEIVVRSLIKKFICAIHRYYQRKRRIEHVDGKRRQRSCL